MENGKWKIKVSLRDIKKCPEGITIRFSFTTTKGSRLTAMYKKIMGIDYGDARTGVAISDLLCSIVGSTYVVPSRNREKAVIDIVKLAKDNMVGEIVVGLPRNMDGTEGVRAQLCREFAEVLKEATGLPVAMWDERRTTVEAHNILSQHNYHGKKRKDTVDAVAASLILEGYLAFKKR